MKRRNTLCVEVKEDHLFFIFSFIEHVNVENIFIYTLTLTDLSSCDTFFVLNGKNII